MLLASTNHHQAFRGLPLKTPICDKNFDVDLFGTVLRKGFEARMPYYQVTPGEDLSMGLPVELMKSQPHATSENYEQCLPAYNEEYFEWIDVIESVRKAKGEYTIVELGAGYGRWSARAIGVLRAINPMPFRIVGVEAEPKHYEYIKQHFTDNNIPLNRAWLICAAVSAENGFANFHVGNASGWYGQAFDQYSKPSWKDIIKHQFDALFKRKELSPTEPGIDVVKTVSLRSILEKLDTVDLMDLDIQCAEYAVLSSCRDLLKQKVMRIHIGTHGPDLEIDLRRMFLGRMDETPRFPIPDRKRADFVRTHAFLRWRADLDKSAFQLARTGTNQATVGGVGRSNTVNLVSTCCGECLTKPEVDPKNWTGT
jgi:FkbM family methyltransferase